MSNRRKFLQQAAFASAPFILPSHVWAAKGDTSPNNRINVAIIGPGKMGRGHAHKLIRNPRAQITGFAEIAEIRTKHTKDLIEKHYSRNTPSDTWKGLTITKNYLELLEDKSLDAVLIATPDHWHGEPTIRAARAKKHVYCEKPISLTIKEGRAMAEAVKENQVVFQTGSQQRTEYGHFPAWRRYREYCNGGLADMGAHHFDIGQWAMDADNTGPVKIIPPKEGTRDLKMIYANGVEVIHGNTPDWRGGTIFYGTEGTIWVDRGPWKSDPENLIKNYKASVSLRQPKNHHDDWLDCIHSGELPLAHVEAGHRTASLCQLSNIGYELRRELTWDPKKEVFVGDKEANKLTDRKRRKKWYRV
jgi:predicted dehydrogenase